MLTIPSLVAVTVGVLTILGLVAVAFVYARGVARKTAAELWRDEATAQKARADRLEAVVADLTKRVDRLEATNEQLAQMASGKAAVAELQTHIDHQHAELVSLIQSSKKEPS